MNLRSILRALPLLALTWITQSAAIASEVRDGAGMFSAKAIQQAESVLGESSVPVVIESIKSLEGRNADDEVGARARRHPDARVYVLIARDDNKLRFLERNARFTSSQSKAVTDAFLSSFKKKDFDGGLVAGSEAVASIVSTWPRKQGANAPAVQVQRRGPVAPNAGGGLGFLLRIGLIILAVMLGMKLLGALFGAGRGGAYGTSARPGMGGPGGGYGPGYGGGYGGGGGFFSGMLGGLGGAMAGNWLYDRMRGGQDSHSSGYSGGDVSGTEATPPEDAGWGGGGGGDWGGGSDSGGGGGDWGGGGGDWGGGGGGGDWGGGGGGGGDW